MPVVAPSKQRGEGGRGELWEVAGVCVKGGESRT